MPRRPSGRRGACLTCRGQIEGVSALADEYCDEVSFVGVGSLDEAPAIEDFAADVPADLPHLPDPEGDVGRRFGVVEQSTCVVLDADSEVVSEGYLDDAELADLVAGLAGRLTCPRDCSRSPWVRACSRRSTRVASLCSRRTSPC